ncbi:MAG TPA: HlyD family efflux transporter periplasmic adaptor subunit [Pyrinomonadaceae bacterium]|jgi:multidrug efflux pump subunit AcrA (membrane-fusion protein)
MLRLTFTRKAILALLTSLLVSASACRSSSSGDQGGASSIIVVNAPAAGVVRRVLVAEGVHVEAGAPIVEIAVPNETQTVAPTPGESAESLAVRNLRSAGTEIEAARKEVIQHEAEVSRLTPLVASGEASQAQLDGERALYERAQQRLQKAQEAERNAQSGLLAARQPGANQPSAGRVPERPGEKIIAAQTSSAGTVRVISARVGQRVNAGQALATLSPGNP